MNKIITYETLRSFAYSNDKICTRPVRGIVLEFIGLGGDSMYDDETDIGRYYAERGIIYVHPYLNPWNWMNRDAVAFTDEIVDVLLERYAENGDIPIVSTGGSMGGLSALVYTKYAARTPVACVANCPVCDLVYHFTERPDLPRTIYSAFFNMEGELDDVLATASPYHLAPEMPKTKYHVFHCTDDTAVNLERHSARFVERMKEHGHSITFDIVPDRGHCSLTDEAREKYLDYITSSVE